MRTQLLRGTELGPMTFTFQGCSELIGTNHLSFPFKFIRHRPRDENQDIDQEDPTNDSYGFLDIDTFPLIRAAGVTLALCLRRCHEQETDTSNLGK